jgi:hypothetical protein
MNTEHIENILRQAPQPTPPAGLLQELNAAIDLPTRAVRPERDISAAGGWFRRWIPALGFAAWFLGCVIVFGVQTSRIAALKEQARAQEAAAAEARAKASSGERNSASAMELERLHNDVADVQRLRAEVSRLREELAELSKLQEENNRLRAELKAQGREAIVLKPEEDFFAVAKERASRIVCINYIKQVGLAARMWANGEKVEVMPRKTASLKPYLGSDKMLFCPSDGTTAYQLVSPGAPLSLPQTVFVRCPIHMNIGLADGSAHMFDSKIQKLVQRDGWTVMERQ